jgi:hypothetical protein
MAAAGKNLTKFLIFGNIFVFIFCKPFWFGCARITRSVYFYTSLKQQAQILGI